MSSNDIPDIKYCSGGTLPTYRFSGYKPSNSRKQEQTSYCYPQLSTLNEAFPESNISKLIADWEGRGNLEISREGEEEGRSQRRKSEKFNLISSRFEKQNMEGGGGEGGTLLVEGSKLDSAILSFWGEGGDRKLRKIRKVRVVRRVGVETEREIPLAGTSSNGKRVRVMNDPEA